jgi:lysozyme
MIDFDALDARILRHEGEVLHAYQDSKGLWTIGRGHLIDQRKGGGISPAASKFIYGEDLLDKQAALDRALPWWRQLDPVRAAVLLELTFNMGIGGLLTFTNTLAAFKDGRWADAAAGLRKSDWARDVQPERVMCLTQATATGIFPY